MVGVFKMTFFNPNFDNSAFIISMELKCILMTFFNNMITIKIRCLNHYIIKNKLAFFSALDNKSF